MPPSAPAPVLSKAPAPVSAHKTRGAASLTIAFPYKSAVLPTEAQDRLQRWFLAQWLSTEDQPRSRYLVTVHAEDGGPISRKLAQDRGDAVCNLIHQLLPPERLDLTSVIDRHSRQAVVAIEPPAPVSPTSAAPLAPPPKPIPAPGGEGTSEKSP